ncbi:MAG TPA: acyl-CoA thioesterase domain-containing protein [Acidimicrobiales bacterium]|nr:acyl-CoA thioesterase domain-containing protein [Acidimicrobiales bacterium]
MADVLFEVDGDRFIPTDATPGPWGETLLHGGALGALLVHVLESTAADDVVPVRFSADFVRPLLRQPLTIESRVARAGKRLELVEGRVRAGDMEMARCTLLAVRPLTIDLPDDAVRAAAPPPDRPDDFDERLPQNPDAAIFLGSGITMRAPDGFQSSFGWFRLNLPTVPGVAPSPLARAAAAADFGLGISSFGEWPPRLAFPNADLVVHCARPVQGEWVRIAASSTWNDTGIGLCTMSLADTTGPVGTGAQSQVLSPAP